jgi:hypothetical protein
MCIESKYGLGNNILISDYGEAKLLYIYRQGYRRVWFIEITPTGEILA